MPVCVCVAPRGGGHEGGGRAVSTKAALPEDMHLYFLHVKNLFLVVTAT